MSTKQPPPYKIGDTIGNFEIAGDPIHKLLPSGYRKWYYPVRCLRCNSGEVKLVRYRSLVDDNTTSCGCLRREVTTQTKTKHGHSKESLYEVWCSMKTRCNDLDNPDYGGRGIRVCEAWQESYVVFRAWALANGYQPDKEIDRINNNGNYCPENCRWVSGAENIDNTRRTRLVTAFGETKTARQWTRDARCLVAYRLLDERLRNGWHPERAITTPRRVLRRRLPLPHNSTKLDIGLAHQ